MVAAVGIAIKPVYPGTKNRNSCSGSISYYALL